MKKKIAITGATGFLGKYLVQDLITNNDIELFLYSTSMAKLKQTFQNESNLHLIETNYSYQSLKTNFTNYYAVVHLAAKRMLPNETTLANYKCNVENTNNLLKVCDEENAGIFIFASSISVYNSEIDTIPFDETEIPHPINAYGWSKLVCENLTKQYKTEMISLRFGQLIGWGEREEYLFSQSLQKIMNNEPITLWGEGGGGRDYLYAKDAVSIIKTAIEKKISGTFNIGIGRPVSFKELVETMAEVFGNNKSIINIDKSKIENREIRYMSIEKAQSEYGWFPNHSLKEAFADMKNAISK